MAYTGFMKDIASFGSILGIWAHPDDETFASGGLAAIASANGQRVCCVTATKGEAGVYRPQDWPADSIALTRAQELSTAQDILGIDEHHWLDYDDGNCSEVDDEKAVQRILPIIHEFQP